MRNVVQIAFNQSDNILRKEIAECLRDGIYIQLQKTQKVARKNQQRKDRKQQVVCQCCRVLSDIVLTLIANQ